jgi:hypothetical protein
MSQEQERLHLDPRTSRAVAELQGMIAKHYPAATFELTHPEDEPASVELTAIVDVDDPDEVLEKVIDRVVELQVDENIPIHVVPIRTPERVQAYLQEQRASRRARRRRNIPLLGRLPLTQH